MKNYCNICIYIYIYINFCEWWVLEVSIPSIGHSNVQQTTLCFSQFFLLTILDLRLWYIFSQGLFHLPSMMFSVPVMIAVYCSSIEALEAGNRELLFLYNKKENLFQKAGKYRNVERGCVGTTEQGRHCDSSASCTCRCEGWDLSTAQ